MRPRLVTMALCALWLLSATAHADDEKKALAHFQKGKELFGKKQYEKAIVEYQAAYDLLPKPKLLYNIARAYDAKGDKRMAVEYYDRYLAQESTGQIAQEATQFRAAAAKIVEAEDARRGGEDDDGDGILNADDKCVAEPEDVDDFDDGDGCPDADNDKDGILDAQDMCSKEA